MAKRLNSILTACTVNVILLTVLIMHNYAMNQAEAVPNSAHNASEIGKKFHKLFDSIAENDAGKSEIHLETLQHEITREQRTFDSAKETLRTFQRKNEHKQKGVNVKSDMGRTLVATKRETNTQDENRLKEIDPSSERIIEKLRQELAEKNEEIEELGQEILDKDDEIAEKSQQIIAKRREIDRKQEQMAAFQEQLLPYRQNTPKIDPIWEE